MKTFKVSLLTFLFCLLYSVCSAQEDFEGQVINKTTEQAILGVTVRLLKGKIATQTNERGYYSLSNDNPQPNDTLQYSYVGYKTLKLAVAAYQPQMFIALEPLIIQLAEVRITDANTQVITLNKFSAYDLKTIMRTGKRVSFITSQTIIAKQFEAPKPDGMLLSVMLGRQDHPMSPSYATKNDATKFILKIYTRNALTGAPGQLLLTKRISLTDNARRVDVDFSKDNLTIPGNSFFVAVEWIITPYNEIIEMQGAAKVERVNRKGQQVYKDATDYVIYYQPFLVGYDRDDNKPPSALYMLRDKKWVQEISYYRELALSATIQY